MNVALAVYYGTLDFTKVSSSNAPDISEMVALRHLHDVYVVRRSSAMPPLEKRSGKLDASEVGSKYRGTVTTAIDELGGPSSAYQKLSEAQPWLNAWVEGEQKGIVLARNVMESEVDHLRSALFGSGGQRDGRSG